MPNRIISDIIAGRSVLTAGPAMAVADAAVAMRDLGVGAIVVTEMGRPLGIFTERDALNRVIAAGLNPRTTPLSQVMTMDAQTIAADRPFGHALHMMYEGRFRHVLVLHNGVLIGMVSTRDALGPELRAFAKEMEDREHIADILG